MVPAMYWLGREVTTNRRVPLLAAGLTCCSSYLLIFSRFAKMYMPLWLFCTLFIGCELWWLRTGRLIPFLAWVASGLAMIGYQPDLEFLGSMGITLQAETQRPLTNEETLESERKGIYLAGVIVAGMHTNEIFIENGRFHGKRIADAIAASL